MWFQKHQGLYFSIVVFLLMNLSVFLRLVYRVFHFAVNNAEAVVLQSSISAGGKKAEVSVD